MPENNDRKLLRFNEHMGYENGYENGPYENTYEIGV